jgi:putative ABC transport system permease protein
MIGMFKVSLAGLRAHKRRLAGTFLAVFLGVAFLAGTLVLSATLSTSIDGFFTRAYAGTDVVIRNAATVGSSVGAQRGPIAAEVADRVRAVDGVAVAAPTIEGFGQIVGRNGTAVSVDGPRVAGNWIGDADLNPYRIASGRAPRADDEVVVNRATAKLGDLHPGDVTTLLTPAPAPVRVTVVGIVTFGNADAYGGTSYVGLTLDAARRYLAAGPAQISSVGVKARPGVGQDELARRIAAVLAPGVEAISGTRLTAENISSIDTGFLSVFRTFLTVFAVVALLVATFSINNTFSILVAQRTREAALLRAIGASRRQILASVVIEALAVGVIATAAGLAGGLGLAALLKSAFAGLGFDLPATGLVFTAATVAICVPVGIGVTLLAAAVPAVRASRVPPLAALREVAFDRARPSVTRLAIGGTLSLAGVVLALTGVGGGGSAMARAGIGAVLTLVGVVALGPAAARPAGALLGAPVALRGVAGVLARRNAMRNPRRTWGAAAALLIGVGVVTLFTVFAASLQESTVDGVKRAFTGDLAVSASQSGNGAVSPQVAADLGRLPQISAATGVGGGSALVAGRSVQVTVADPTALARVMNLDPAAGSVEHLAAGQFAVAENVARDRAWHTGASVTVGYADGATDTLTLGGIYRANPLLGDYLLPERTWRAHTSPYVDSVVYVALAGGADTGRARQAVTAAVAPYGAPTVRDRQQLIDASAKDIGQLLSVVYVMLVLAILIALMGIANTLSLAVHERTRELGVLRAVGATRRQIRFMVRWESAITAVFGTLGGLGVGAFLGWVLVRAASGQGISTFAAPPVPLTVVLIGGAVAGLLAGLLPARRAARLHLLQAIATE